MSSIGYVIVNLRFSHKKSSILYLYNCIVSSFCPDCKTNLFFCRGFFGRPVSRGRFPPNLRPQTGQNLCKSGIAPVDMTSLFHEALSLCRQSRHHQCRAAPQVGRSEGSSVEAAFRQRADGEHPARPFYPPAQPLKALRAAEPPLEDDVLDAASTGIQW